MSAHTEFRCDEDIVRMVESAKLSLHALRVFYGLHYLIDSDPSRRVTMMAPPHRRPMQVKGRKIIQSTFPTGTNDLRQIRTVKDALIESKIMAHFDYVDQESALEFRYSDKAILAAEQRKVGKFAIVDSDWLARLSTPSQIMFYVRMKMHEEMKAPMFYIPGISTGTSWQQMKKPWLRAAEKLSIGFGHQFLFCPEVDRMSEQVIAVRVKISHQRTTWYPGSLYCRTADKPPIAVSTGTSRAITRNELVGRAQWTTVEPPSAKLTAK